jgi:hypothetical protein
MRADEPTGADPLDAETVRQLCGDISDETVIAILGAGATVAEVEAAVAWLRGQSETMGEEPHALEGAAAQVYDLLIEEEPPVEEA